MAKRPRRHHKIADAIHLGGFPGGPQRRREIQITRVNSGTAGVKYASSTAPFLKIQLSVAPPVLDISVVDDHFDDHLGKDHRISSAVFSASTRRTTFTLLEARNSS
jgi:hypothetical protein